MLNSLVKLFASFYFSDQVGKLPMLALQQFPDFKACLGRHKGTKTGCRVELSAQFKAYTRTSDSAE